MPLDAQVVQGEGYTWTGPLNRPRDFYYRAALELQQTGDHTVALKQGLLDAGIKADLK